MCTRARACILLRHRRQKQMSMTQWPFQLKRKKMQSSNTSRVDASRSKSRRSFPFCVHVYSITMRSTFAVTDCLRHGLRHICEANKRRRKGSNTLSLFRRIETVCANYKCVCAFHLSALFPFVFVSAEHLCSQTWRDVRQKSFWTFYYFRLTLS